MRLLVFFREKYMPYYEKQLAYAGKALQQCRVTGSEPVLFLFALASPKI